MPKQIWAITTCRVSTPEQIENNSLNRQEEAVLRAANELGAYIPPDGQWSGSVSSKAGTNINRKDLKAMLDYCKKHPQVKYLLVHEVDRFMRSVKELFYFEVEFEKLGVKVWYASQPELNQDDYHAKLLKALEAFKGEGSNVERQKKSIDGQTTALLEGRYPFPPKAGYKRGYEKAVHEIDPVRGPILRDTMLRIIARLVTPTQALIELSKTDFVKGRAVYKMDKFRKILTDPYYAGIVEINKQVKVRNENGLHDPLITKEQHLELIKIMAGKPKNQAGPRKNGNPKYPLNNLVNHEPCADEKYGRVVGVDIDNGKNKARKYEKYRCRACKRSIPRDILHAKIEKQISQYFITDASAKDLLAALNRVWKQKEGEKEQDLNRLRFKIRQLNNSIAQQVEAATNPENAIIKQEILAAIAKKKEDLVELEAQIEKTKNDTDYNKERFLEFAFSFIDNIGEQFLDPSLSDENRKRFKQIVFPSGFSLDADQNVYTPEISPLIRLATNKKDLPVTEKSSMVRVRRL